MSMYVIPGFGNGAETPTRANLSPLHVSGVINPSVLAYASAQDIGSQSNLPVSDTSEPGKYWTNLYSIGSQGQANYLAAVTLAKDGGNSYIPMTPRRSGPENLFYSDGAFSFYLTRPYIQAPQLALPLTEADNLTKEQWERLSFPAHPKAPPVEYPVALVTEKRYGDSSKTWLELMRHTYPPDQVLIWWNGQAYTMKVWDAILMFPPRPTNTWW